MKANLIEDRDKREAIITWMKQQVLGMRYKYYNSTELSLNNLSISTDGIHMSDIMELAIAMGWTFITVDRHATNEYVIECYIMFDEVKFYSIYTLQEYESRVNKEGI